MVSSQLILNDCLVAMKEMADNSVDSIVTDPPYGLSFMGKQWDYDVPSVEIWKEALRVLKPGGHLLAFAGSRTYHRLAVNVEDAGFEIRDQIMWIYGSGFPKSHNISKAIDKAAGVEQEVIGIGRSGAPETHQTSYNMSRGAGTENRDNFGGEYEITKPTTPEAEQWDGWGTALKPAHEPVVVARKPVENTIVENVLEHGTGAINIDGCRVGDIVQDTSKNGRSADKHKSTVYESGLKKDFEGKITTGRFPANVIMDKEAGEILDEQSGDTSSTRIGNPKNAIKTTNNKLFGGSPQKKEATSHDYRDTGGASRFFYQVKEDNKITHEPVVVARKPLEGTVVDNVLEHGTGGLNIDVSRIEHNDPMITRKNFNSNTGEIFTRAKGDEAGPSPKGRFPANVIMDKEAGEVLDEQTGELSAGHAPKLSKGNPFSGVNDSERQEIHYEKGGASRFFYQVKEDNKITHEPVVVARKPLEGTVVDNVLEHETGGLNIDGCRIQTDEVITNHSRSKESSISKGKYGDSKEQETHQTKGQALGRFPANVILDDEAGNVLDNQSGHLKSGNMDSIAKGGQFNTYGVQQERHTTQIGDEGGASRFFYCAKPSRAERDGGVERKNIHPTVKPVDLMRYLCRLVTPPNGITLDPFMGSGTTGIAANLEGFSFIGIEMSEEYLEIARARIAHSGDYEITEDLTMKRIKQPSLLDFLGGSE